MEIDFLITSFVALFVIIDPIGLTPLFVALTQGMSAKVVSSFLTGPIAMPGGQSYSGPEAKLYICTFQLLLLLSL